MGSFSTVAGVTKLSQLEIDVNKDWGSHVIKNLGEPVDANDALRNAVDSELTKRLFESMQRFRGLYWFNNNWLPSEMIEYGVSGSGYVDWASRYVTPKTGTTAGSYAYIHKGVYGLGRNGSWNKKRYLGVEVLFVDNADVLSHIVWGGITDYTALANTDAHIGFKQDNDAIYGTVADGANESTLTLATGISTSTYMTLECIYDPGVECRFYLDGTDMGAITTNLPSGTDSPSSVLYASVYNKAVALEKYYRIIEYRAYQEE